MITLRQGEGTGKGQTTTRCCRAPYLYGDGACYDDEEFSLFVISNPVILNIKIFFIFSLKMQLVVLS